MFLLPPGAREPHPGGDAGPHPGEAGRVEHGPGRAGSRLAELPEETVGVTVRIFDASGALLGLGETEATARYGDILIDGVPLEFD